MDDDFESRWLELREDNRSGSREIASRAAALVRELAADESLNRTELMVRLREACRRLERAHSSMAAVRSFCDDVILTLDTTPPERELRQRLRDRFEKWDELFTRRLLRRISSHAYGMLREADTIVSHSYSSTVLGVIGTLMEKRSRLQVIQSVSMPAKEGLHMALSLAELEVDVEVISDAGLAAALGRADIALVGADSVGLDGVVNKLGTLGLAAAASRLGVPIYCLADSTKLLAPGTDVPIKAKNPSEVAAAGHERIKVTNVYFDLTPVELFTAVITEEGAYTPSELLNLIGFPASASEGTESGA